MNATKTLDPLTFSESWNAGQVARFHAENVLRRQTVGEHSWGVALICLTLWPEEPRLLGAAILHDVPEVVLGDVPHPAKSLIVDQEREERAEALLLQNYPRFTSLNPENRLRLKIADMIEFVFYVQREFTMGNKLVCSKIVKGTELTLKRIEALASYGERLTVRKFFEESMAALLSDNERYA